MTQQVEAAVLPDEVEVPNGCVHTSDDIKDILRAGIPALTDWAKPAYARMLDAKHHVAYAHDGTWAEVMSLSIRTMLVRYPNGTMYREDPTEWSIGTVEDAQAAWDAANKRYARYEDRLWRACHPDLGPRPSVWAARQSAGPYGTVTCES